MTIVRGELAEEAQQLLGEVRSMTKKMRAASKRLADLGRERRALIMRINRDYPYSFTRLEYETGLSRSRLNSEVARAKEEAGITEEHPRYPSSFKDNGA